MKRNILRVIIIVESIIIAIGAIIFLINYREYNRYIDGSGLVLRGEILGYKETSEGLVIIANHQPTDRPRCYIVEDLSAVCSDPLHRSVIEKRLIGVEIKIVVGKYFYKDSLTTPNYYYPVNTILIPPREIDRIQAEGLLPSE